MQKKIVFLKITIARKCNSTFRNIIITLSKNLSYLIKGIQLPYFHGENYLKSYKKKLFVFYECLNKNRKLSKFINKYTKRKIKNQIKREFIYI